MENNEDLPSLPCTRNTLCCVHECASQPCEFSITDGETELLIDELDSDEISTMFHFICVPIYEGRTVTTTLKLDDADDTERLSG